MVTIFDEVGDLARYMNSMNVEMKRLKQTVDELKLYAAAGGADEEDSPSKKSGKATGGRPGSRQASRGSPTRK